eukprot:TRINITY_DN2926_c0_g1_i1.p1 TRINITY_DN2926_c0_g1~~TRINITY_DN2926_c0_g1_i1.p1  ORF type:complete len:250 (-),score=62.72 TRINITY_DN2926_c0_g1_i1:69-797(-)
MASLAFQSTAAPSQTMSFDQSAASPAMQRGFDPYVNNGGSTIAIAGKDYVVIAGDTRVSSGYSIHTRKFSKLHQVTPKCIIAASGMQADVKTLRKVLDAKLSLYKQTHHKDISTTSFAQLLSNTLYGNRFRPYYSFNVVGGLDSEGKGAVYSYDAIGSFERVQYSASGSGQTLMIPLMDNQVAFKNQSLDVVPDLPLERVVDMVKDAFVSATERDIYTGDSLEIACITKEGIKYETVPLRRD